MVASGRETFLVSVEWDDDDWPVINEGMKISLQSTGPGLYQYEVPVAWRDDFASPQLQLGWYRKSKYNTEIFGIMAELCGRHPFHCRLLTH